MQAHLLLRFMPKEKSSRFGFYPQQQEAGLDSKDFQIHAFKGIASAYTILMDAHK
jgi:hypothetical protein